MPQVPTLQLPPGAINWPETGLGCVRPLSTIKRQFSGLFISEDSLLGLLILGDGTETVGSRHREECARKLAVLLSRWMQVLVVTAADLYNAEQLWSEEEIDVQNVGYEELETKYYAVFEYRYFLSASWEIIQELSYMAISHEALLQLREYAAYEKKHPLDSFPALVKECPGSVLAEAITCLLSSSRSRIAHSAINNTTATLNPCHDSPEDDTSTTTTVLTLGYQKADHISAGIRGFLSTANHLRPKRMKGDGRGSRKGDREVSKLQYMTNGAQVLVTLRALTATASFRRFSQRTIRVENDFHLDSRCVRCQKEYPEMLTSGPWQQNEILSLGAYGAILAAREESEGHDLCLLVDERSSWLDRETAVPVIVEDLLQSGYVLHAVSTGTKADEFGEYIKWNLPFVYRKSTTTQRWRISRWIQQQTHQPLREEEPPKQDLKTQEKEQMMLHLFRRGFGPDDAGSFIQSWVETTKAEPFSSLRLDHFISDLPRQTSKHTPSSSAYWYVGEVLHLEGGI